MGSRTQVAPKLPYDFMVLVPLMARILRRLAKRDPPPMGSDSRASANDANRRGGAEGLGDTELKRNLSRLGLWGRKSPAVQE